MIKDKISDEVLKLLLAGKTGTRSYMILHESDCPVHTTDDLESCNCKITLVPVDEAM